jgi:hypothetical protein
VLALAAMPPEAVGVRVAICVVGVPAAAVAGARNVTLLYPPALGGVTKFVQVTEPLDPAPPDECVTSVIDEGNE